MSKIENTYFLPVRLRKAFDAWTDEVEQEVLESKSAAKFFIKLEAYSEIFEEMSKRDQSVDLDMFFSLIEKLIAKTLAKEVPKFAEILKSRKRRVDSSTLEMEVRDLYSKQKLALDSIFKLASLQNDEMIDKLPSDWQTGLVDVHDDETPLKGLFRRLFEEANAQSWAELSPKQLDELESTIEDARHRQAEMLLGLSEGEKITIGGMNKFLASRAEKEMENSEKQQIARLVQTFREAGNRLFLNERECVMGTSFEPATGIRRFVFRDPGGKGASFKKKQTLPSDLKFSKS